MVNYQLLAKFIDELPSVLDERISLHSKYNITSNGTMRMMIAFDLAGRLASENPRFKPKVFFKACGFNKKGVELLSHPQTKFERGEFVNETWPSGEVD